MMPEWLCCRFTFRPLVRMVLSDRWRGIYVAIGAVIERAGEAAPPVFCSLARPPVSMVSADAELASRYP